MIIRIPAPNDPLERGLAAFLRGFLITTFRSLIGPRLGVKSQRKWVQFLALLMPGHLGLKKRHRDFNGLAVNILTPRNLKKPGAILFFHGGAFCLGSPYTHRSICSNLSYDSGLPVWVPDYRLSPEHPYPCALEDAVAAYEEMLRHGIKASNIVIAGDSAGASLALALTITLNGLGKDRPACVMLASPVTDGNSPRQKRAMGGRDDPMLTMGWLHQGLTWFNPPSDASAFSPLKIDLSGLPPILIQVGQEEILLNDSLQLEDHAVKSGVDCRLELYLERWHVFHLQSFYLKSSRAAIKAMATFALSHISK